ncbi:MULTISPECIES: hypothetical protein [Sporomusa]|jgi:hypothetical protein|uniref:4Fe-4S ferredoxin-type domain-containing protein n=1 Tax=Sporomusa sphaeroides DSM 2875 TaxID=1337886 RepID=A0ABP2CCL1_9FIRM|nr:MULTISPECIES: hypothetical protein [Sporomusa]OLS55974.1 hypothetical protein SPSPH_23610 [Sporomusa sphaeroides DSM 2875]CVK20185.1 hypothetical protein SSPH_02852 [Sporomusa sphaeroides DSM 2875]HML33581.1 hypothetical protein [Sporomusa sphaeroides]
MLQRKSLGCDSCIESNSCEFSSEFCPKATLELSPDQDLESDPAFKKYREFYQRFSN